LQIVLPHQFFNTMLADFQSIHIGQMSSYTSLFIARVIVLTGNRATELKKTIPSYLLLSFHYICPFFLRAFSP
jgi:hypothetical protein